MNDTLLVATRSDGKLRELFPLLQPLGMRLVTLADVGVAESSAEDDLECFDTFEENAFAKGRYFHALTGLPTVADDSGLEVLALGGRPGVLSKRWSGRKDLAGEALDEANRVKLISELAAVADRRARYVCAAVFVNESLEMVQRGETAGAILHERRGSGGFGYDMYFLSDDLGVTLAACPLDRKQGVSHRGRAFEALVRRILSERG